MSTTTELPAEALSRLFLDSEAPLGQTWQQSACPVLAESLHGLVLDFCKANQMNKVARRYWKPEPELLVYLQQEHLRLNPLQPQPLLERLCTLHTDTAGGIILVTKQFSNDGLALDHIITIIAAPLLHWGQELTILETHMVNLQFGHLCRIM